MYEIALVVHIVGVILGLGAATVSDVQSMRSLADEVIKDDEESLLKWASFVIWAGLALLLISGAVMFYLNWDVLSGQSRMQAHVSIAAIIILNGLWINFSIAPKLSDLSRKKTESSERMLQYRKIRKLAFLSGAISLPSWWLTFLLGMARRFPFSPPSYLEYMLAYLVIIAMAIAAAQYVEKMSWKRHMQSV